MTFFTWLTGVDAIEARMREEMQQILQRERLAMREEMQQILQRERLAMREEMQKEMQQILQRERLAMREEMKAKDEEIKAKEEEIKAMREEISRLKQAKYVQQLLQERNEMKSAVGRCSQNAYCFPISS